MTASAASLMNRATTGSKKRPPNARSGATPSALHAPQTCQALEAGTAVFCQKPLARTADETRQVIRAARRADRILGVDLSYRFVDGVPQMRELVRSGELGTVFAADLVFHNAYGPDKPWFYDVRQSGGGCWSISALIWWIWPNGRWATNASRPSRAGCSTKAG